MPATLSTRRRPRTTRCKRCEAKIKVKNKGPVPKYCCQSCKQEAYLTRRLQPVLPISLRLLSHDLASIELKEIIRTTLMELLVQQGLVPQPTKNKSAPPKPSLRLVENEPADPKDGIH